MKPCELQACVVPQIPPRNLNQPQIDSKVQVACKTEINHLVTFICKECDNVITQCSESSHWELADVLDIDCSKGMMLFQSSTMWLSTSVIWKKINYSRLSQGVHWSAMGQEQSSEYGLYFYAGQCLSQDLVTGCLKLAVVTFLGVQIFRGDHNILIFQP